MFVCVCVCGVSVSVSVCVCVCVILRPGLELEDHGNAGKDEKHRVLAVLLLSFRESDATATIPQEFPFM